MPIARVSASLVHGVPIRARSGDRGLKPSAVYGSQNQSVEPRDYGCRTIEGLNTNISSSVVWPAVMAHASHQPSPAPADESHAASSPHAPPTLPFTHATGLQ